MKWVSIQQIAQQTGKHVNSVRRGLRAAGMMPESERGVRGKRIPTSKANRFIAKQWPGAPMIPEEGAE